jgi:hypothetical protein
MWGVHADLSSPRQSKWPEKIIGQKNKKPVRPMNGRGEKKSFVRLIPTHVMYLEAKKRGIFAIIYTW